MKLIKDWTQEERSHFLTLFMGRCWHEIENALPYIDGWGRCKCGKNLWKPIYNENISFGKVKSFMEKEWPEIWEQYLAAWLEDMICVSFTNRFNGVLDFSNLIEFLLEPEQVERWGWVKCIDCKGTGSHYIVCEVDDRIVFYPKCDKGKIKHPALIFAEGIK